MEISSCVSVLLLVPHSTVVSDCRMDWVRELRWNCTMCSEPFLEAKALLKWRSLLRRQFRHTLRHFLFSSPCTCKSSEMKLIKLKIFTPATKHIVQFSCSIVVSFKLSCRAICEVLVGKSRGACAQEYFQILQQWLIYWCFVWVKESMNQLKGNDKKMNICTKCNYPLIGQDLGFARFLSHLV